MHRTIFQVPLVLVKDKKHKQHPSIQVVHLVLCFQDIAIIISTDIGHDGPRKEKERKTLGATMTVSWDMKSGIVKLTVWHQCIDRDDQLGD